MTSGDIKDRRLPASIEVLAKQVLGSSDLAEVLPAGATVYVPDVGADDEATTIAAARRLTDLGFIPVPHLAARRVASRSALERRVGALAEEAGVADVLIIGGAPAQPAGEFTSSLDVIETGLFDRFGIGRIGVAGHPDGSNDFTARQAMAALRFKQEFWRRSDADLRVVTQFSFSGHKVIDWIRFLDQWRIDFPVHVGVAGPCRISSLLKYAAVCGIDNSLSAIRKQGSRLLSLATGYDPEAIVQPIEAFSRSVPGSMVERLHIFSFGGKNATSAWLRRRGSW